MNIEISAYFKKMTTKAILSIALFLIVYIFLLCGAIGLTILCAIGGFYVITVRPSFITLALGVGLASLGFFILAFLFKFMFKKHTIDRSHLTEITAEMEPKLFQVIESIVKEVGTDFPKKIYLSQEVNASVFYDSSFWSMFFPVKKNLQIGLGLVNTITEQEFKAILAHEFGHFSQRSMKVGSYVYYVNQVIFNMLYDNDSFDKMIQKWANVSGYFSIFLIVSVKIIEGIQWILKKMYELINVTYLALSREMEFHADEVAANVAGILPLQESLLRMDLVDASYNTVLNFYSDKITQRFKSKNIYKEQLFVLDFLAKSSQLQFKNDLPIVASVDINKFNKSKLVIENQWASHPSVEDRCANLDRVNIHKEDSNNHFANSIFQNIEKLQETQTAKLFSNIENVTDFEVLSFEEFSKDYENQFEQNTFNKIYNGYYDNKNPNYFDINNLAKPLEQVNLDYLFDKEKIDLVYEFIALKNDEITIKNIADGYIKIKYFDYDGHKFKAKEASELISEIEKNSKTLEEAITKNDIAIFCYFQNKAKKDFQDGLLIMKYKAFFDYDKDYDKKIDLYSKLVEATQFMSVVTPIEKIKSNLNEVYKLEIEIKREIADILLNELYAKEITTEIKESFEMYLKEEWLYFTRDKYIDSELEIYYKAMNNYNFLLSRGYFLLKKDLLDFQNQLLTKEQVVLEN
jgi:Zn-dependent protease with chaperone function